MRPEALMQPVRDLELSAKPVVYARHSKPIRLAIEMDEMANTDNTI
jgi:hypothetical protein